MRATNGNHAIAGLLLAWSVAAHAQDLAATLGRERAVGSRVEWEIREAGHPALGNIRFAYVKRPVETQVGNSTVFSRAYLSCQRGVGKLAIELSNAMAPADPSGLRPAVDPRLICNRPTSADKIEREEILATWKINEKIGDALTQGLRPFPLRECAAITVVQEVTMPAGSAQKTARIEFDLLPYNRELDSIFESCGERSAYGPGSPPPKIAAAPAAAVPASAPPPQPKSLPAAQASAPPATQASAPPAKASPPPAQPSPTPAQSVAPPTQPVLPIVRLSPPPAQPTPPPAQPTPPPAQASPPSAQPTPPPAQPKPVQATDSSWQSARAVPTGMTNVRSAPTLQSSIIVQLYPGAVVQVQRTATDWWRARTKTPKGAVIEGYIREDRLVFK